MAWADYEALPEVTVTRSGDTITSVTVDGLEGAEGDPVIIDAEWDEIDGGGAVVPLTFTGGSTYVKLNNFLAHDSSGSVCIVNKSSHIDLSSGLLWNARWDDNSHVFTTNQSSHIHLADMAGWGTGRKIFQIFRSDDCSLTRVWGRWQYSTTTGPKLVFAPTYSSFRCLMEDCIGVIGGPAVSEGDGPWPWGPDGMLYADPPDVDAESIITRCIGINSFGDHAFVVKPGLYEYISMTLVDCMNASRNYAKLVNVVDVLALRQLWAESPIRDKMIQYAHVDPVRKLDDLLYREGHKAMRGRSRNRLMLPGADYPYGRPAKWLDASRGVIAGAVADATADDRDAVLNASHASNYAATKGLQFDGVDDCARIESGSEVSANESGAGTSFSFLVKFKITKPPPEGLAVIFGESDSSQEAAGLAYIAINVSGHIQWQVAGDVRTGTVFGNLADGQIHTALCWYDAVNGYRRIYVDGTETMATGLTTENVSAADATMIGGSLRSTGARLPFNGIVYECGRFPSIISEAAYNAYHNAATWPAATCTGRWTFTGDLSAEEDGKISAVRSRSSGSAFTQGDASLQPTLRVISGRPSIELNGAYLSRLGGELFSQRGHYMAVVYVPIGSRLLNKAASQRFVFATQPAYASGDATLELWANVTTDSYLLGTGGASATNRGLSLSVSADNGVWLRCSNGTASVNRTVYSMSFRKWTHLVGVIDRTAGTSRVWLNGVDKGTADISALAGTYTPTTGRTLGGYRHDNALYTAAGCIAFARIAIGSAYSESEVLQSYNGGRGCPYAELPAELKAKITYAWDLAESSGNAIEAVAGNHGVATGTDTNILTGPRPGPIQTLYSQADVAGAVNYCRLGINDGGRLHYQCDNAGDRDELIGAILLTPGYHLLEWASDGDAVSLRLDGAADTITIVDGANSGRWFGDVASVDRSVLGGLLNSGGFAAPWYGNVVETLGFDDPLAREIVRARRNLLNTYGIAQ